MPLQGYWKCHFIFLILVAFIHMRAAYTFIRARPNSAMSWCPNPCVWLRAAANYKYDTTTIDGKYYNRSLLNEKMVAFLDSMTADIQLVLVLIGLPGCGKSTVAKQLIELSLQRGKKRCWDIVCQDKLGNRKKAIAAARKSIELGRSIVVDRCNFDSTQREHWISLARSSSSAAATTIATIEEDRKVSVVGLILPNHGDVDFCSKRAFERGDDGVHEPGTDWKQVCHRMKSDFQLPTMDEGFDGIYFSDSEDDTNVIIDILSNLP